MNKKRLLAMLTAGAMMTFLAACGGSNSGADANANANADANAAADTGADAAADAGASGGSYNISVILKTTAAEYWQYVKAGCEAYAAENDGVTVEVKGPSSETAYDEQQNMIETDLNNVAYDAFAISPLQSDMVSTLIAGQTKPILALDTNIEAPEIKAFVGTGCSVVTKDNAQARMDQLAGYLK